MARGAVSIAALSVLAACAAQIPPVEVTRFHAEGPVAQTGGIVVEPMAGTVEAGIEFRTYAGAVAQELQRVGFTDETGKQTFAASEYVAYLGYSRDLRSPTASRSPVSVGVGGSTGSYGSGLGVGIGINLSGKPKPLVTTQLSVQIRRRADDQAVWEGRAVTQAKDGSPAAQPGIAAEKLAAALFSGYPGKSGETITVK
ncbi:MAG: hypothetical protein AB7U35_11210 [Sphingobium sp.]